LYEENITRSAGGQHGQFISQRSLESAIASSGRRSLVRDTIYSFQNQELAV